jgi:hypothetical protein
VQKLRLIATTEKKEVEMTRKYREKLMCAAWQHGSNSTDPESEDQAQRVVASDRFHAVL